MGAYAPSRHFCPEMWLPIFFFDLFRKVSTEARCWGSPPPNGNGWRLCEGWEYIDSFNSNLRLLINPMEWFPPPFSVARWDAWVVEGPWQATRKGKRPSRTFDPDNKARRCVEGSWRDDRRSSSGHWRGKRAASRPQVAQESLQGHPKVTSHVMDVTPKAENTFEVAWEAWSLRSSQIEHCNTQKWPKKQEYPSNILSR